MNNEDLKTLKDLWQSRLKLNHWCIKIRNSTRSETQGNIASAEINYGSLEALLKIVTKLDSGELIAEEEIIKSVVHELLHLHLSGLMVVLDTPEHIAEEHAVQILTRVIIEAFETNGGEG